VAADFGDNTSNYGNPAMFTKMGHHNRLHQKLYLAVASAILVPSVCGLPCNVTAGGITVITHGGTILSGNLPDWPLEMARDIATRAGGGSVYVNNTDSGSANFGKWQADSGFTNSNDPQNEIVLVYDWASEANNHTFNSDGWAAAAGDNLFANIADLTLPGIPGKVSFCNRGMHIIGHSRGPSVNSELVRQLGMHFANYVVDHVTTLDPHPANTLLDGSDDADPVTYDNVRFADNYWRTNNVSVDLNGQVVPGAHNIMLIDSKLSGGHFTSHTNVRLWYNATIDPNKMEIDKKDVSGVSWWTAGTNYSAAEEPLSGRNMVGFNRSRIGGEQPHPSNPSKQSPTGFFFPAFISNGTFDFGPASLGPDDNIPGWGLHGGGGTGHIESSDGNRYLQLDDLEQDYFRTHDPLYIPSNATHIFFDIWIEDASNNDQFVVSIGSTELLRLDLDTTTGGFTFRQAPIPDNLRNTSNTLTFKIVGDVDSQVNIDDVGFILDGHPSDEVLNCGDVGTGAVSFSVDGGALNASNPTPNPTEGLENVVHHIGPNDVYVLGTAPANGISPRRGPGGHGLATEGEIFVSGTGGVDMQPNGANIDRLSGALGNVPRVGEHVPVPAAAPDTAAGVLGLERNDNVISLSYGKDSGEVLYFSVHPFSIGADNTDVKFQSIESPGPHPVVGPVPENPGGGDPGNEAAGDIFASPIFSPFGSYGFLHLLLGKTAPLIASPQSNRLLYDERKLGLQAPADNGLSIGNPQDVLNAEDDLDALELADPSDVVWGVDFINTNGVLEPGEDPVWFSLDEYSPSVGLPTQLVGGTIPRFTFALDVSVSTSDILMTPPGVGEDVNGNGILDPGEDFDGDTMLDPFIFGVYASGTLDIDLLESDILDALVLSDVGLRGFLDSGDEALFSLDALSPSLAAFGVSAADVFYTDFDRPFNPWEDWKKDGSLYASHGSLGLLFMDELNALDIRPTPEPSTVLLVSIGALALVPYSGRRHVKHAA